MNEKPHIPIMLHILPVRQHADYAQKEFTKIMGMRRSGVKVSTVPVGTRMPFQAISAAALHVHGAPDFLHASDAQ